jgi:hypothetical protein
MFWEDDGWVVLRRWPAVVFEQVDAPTECLVDLVVGTLALLRVVFDLVASGAFE